MIITSMSSRHSQLDSGGQDDSDWLFTLFGKGDSDWPITSLPRNSWITNFDWITRQSENTGRSRETKCAIYNHKFYNFSDGH